MRSRGSGAPLLLLHGWGGRADSFLPVTRDFSAARTVYAVDFPGHGNSPEPPAPWSVTEYMELIWAFIPSNGYIWLRYHRPFPSVAAWRCCSPPSIPKPCAAWCLPVCAGLRPRSSGKKSMRNARLQGRCAPSPTTASPAACWESALRRGAKKLVQRFGSADYKALSKTMRPTFNRVIAQDLRGVLPRIQASTLLIWGTEDKDTPLWMGEVMEKEIPDAALVRLEGCGHFAYLEKYADFRAIAWKFLIG